MQLWCVYTGTSSVKRLMASLWQGVSMWVKSKSDFAKLYSFCKLLHTDALAIDHAVCGFSEVHLVSTSSSEVNNHDLVTYFVFSGDQFRWADQQYYVRTSSTSRQTEEPDQWWRRQAASQAGNLKPVRWGVRRRRVSFVISFLLWTEQLRPVYLNTEHIYSFDKTSNV